MSYNIYKISYTISVLGKKSTSGEVLKKCFPLIVATQPLPSWYEKIEKTPFTKVFSHDGNNYIQIV